jgi:hypothetical protein
MRWTHLESGAGLNGKEYHIEDAGSHTRIRIRICCIELHAKLLPLTFGKHSSQLWTSGLLSVYVNAAEGLYSLASGHKLYGTEYECRLQLKMGQQCAMHVSRNLGDEQWWNQANHFTVYEPQIECLHVRIWTEATHNLTEQRSEFLEPEVPEMTDAKESQSKGQESNKATSLRSNRTLLLCSGRLLVRSLLAHNCHEDRPIRQSIELPLHGRLKDCRLHLICVYQTARYKDDLIKAYEESGASAYRFAELEHFTEHDEK